MKASESKDATCKNINCANEPLNEEFQSIEEEKIKTVSDIIGEWGPFQYRLLFLYLAIYIIAPFQNLGVVVYTDKVDFWCKLPPGVDKNTVNATQCTVYGSSNVTCTEWEYDRSYYKRNMIQEFDLVCDKRIYVSYAKSIYQLGYLLSSLVFGWFSDKYGRRLSLRVSILLELSMSLLQAVSPNIEIFLISRFFLGVGAYSRFLTGMLILLEWASPKNRARVQLISEFGWTAGRFLLPAVYVPLADFRHTQLVVFTWELLMLIPTWLYYPDSANWLILKGRYKEVEETLTVASSINQTGDAIYVKKKLEILKHNIIKEEKERESESKKSIIDLWMVPRLAMFSFVIYVMWFSISFINYGSSYNVGDLGGSIYVNWYMFMPISLLKKVIVVFIINMFDRRTLISSFYLSAALFNFVMIPFTFDETDLWKRRSVAMIAAFCGSSGFDLLYLQTAEIFPTGMRQLGVGSGSVAARFAAIAAPFVHELTTRVHFSATVALFAGIKILVALIVWVLPKTKDKPIPNTLEEAERRKDKGKKKRKEEEAVDMEEMKENYS